MKHAAEKTDVSNLQDFAHWGEGTFAYVKPMLSEEASRLFPQAGAIRPGLKLFALVGANGAPIMLADSKDAIIQGAWDHELHTVSLH